MACLEVCSAGIDKFGIIGCALLSVQNVTKAKTLKNRQNSPRARADPDNFSSFPRKVFILLIYVLSWARVIRPVQEHWLK